MSAYKYNAKKTKRSGRKGIRIALTTEHIAEMLDTTADAVRMRIKRGKLVFTGDPIQDFHMLCQVVTDSNR